MDSNDKFFASPEDMRVSSLSNNNYLRQYSGSIQLICGPMFSGKSTELMVTIILYFLFIFFLRRILNKINIYRDE